MYFSGAQTSLVKRLHGYPQGAHTSRVSVCMFEIKYGNQACMGILKSLNIVN